MAISTRLFNAIWLFVIISAFLPFSIAAPSSFPGILVTRPFELSKRRGIHGGGGGGDVGPSCDDDGDDSDCSISRAAAAGIIVGIILFIILVVALLGMNKWIGCSQARKRGLGSPWKLGAGQLNALGRQTRKERGGTFNVLFGRRKQNGEKPTYTPNVPPASHNWQSAPATQMQQAFLVSQQPLPLHQKPPLKEQQPPPPLMQYGTPPPQQQAINHQLYAPAMIHTPPSSQQQQPSPHYMQYGHPPPQQQPLMQKPQSPPVMYPTPPPQTMQYPPLHLRQVGVGQRQPSPSPSPPMPPSQQPPIQQDAIPFDGENMPPRY